MSMRCKAMMRVARAPATSPRTQVCLRGRERSGRRFMRVCAREGGAGEEKNGRDDVDEMRSRLQRSLQMQERIDGTELRQVRRGRV